MTIEGHIIRVLKNTIKAQEEEIKGLKKELDKYQGSPNPNINWDKIKNPNLLNSLLYNSGIDQFEIPINNWEESKNIQQEAFELGFKWCDSGKRLITYKKGIIILNTIDKTMEHYSD
jgi:hypothetical protein